MIYDQEFDLADAPPATTVAEDPDDQADALAYIRDAANKDDPHLFAMRGAAYTNILFVHGLQHHAFHLTRGVMEDISGDEDSTVTINMLLSIVEGQLGYLIGSEGEIVAVPTTRDDRDIEAAHYATDFAKWVRVEFDLDDVQERAGSLFVETGGVYLFSGWDPAAGRMFLTQDGQPVFEGRPLIKEMSLFAVTLHPQATSYKNSPYAHISEMVHRSWVEEHYPEIMQDLGLGDQSVYGHDTGLVFENALKVLGPSHGSYQGGSFSDMDGHPREEGYYEIQHVYVRSCPKYPTGRMIVALARNGTAVRILADLENPYVDHSTGRRTLPLIYIPNIRVPMRALGESIVQHAIPMQQIINKHRRQILDNADLNGNPRIYKPEGIPDEAFTNEVGGMIDVPAGANPPGYMQAPELPAYIAECEASAMRFLEILTRPTGPLRSESEKITSGIHKMIVEEEKKALIAPTVRRWRNGWKEFWRLTIDNWRTFSTVPQRMEVPGDDGSWRESYFSGELARSNFVMEIREASPAASSQTAMFAQWSEILKIPELKRLDPRLAAQMFKDIGRPEIARTYRDNTVHTDKARRNIQRVRMGELRMAEPQDEVEDHLNIYRDWMCTPEYEMEAMRDQSFALRMGVLLQSFQQALAMQVAQQMEAAAAMNPGGDDGSNGGGDGGYPRMTQGASRAAPKNSPPRPNRQGGESSGVMS